MKNSGFLLIEVLLSVTILAVSLTVISHALMAVYKNSVFARDYSMGSFLLESKMGALFQKKNFPCPDYETGQFEKPFERFRYTLESSAPQTHLPIAVGTGGQDEKTSDHLCEVTLNVSWPSGKRDRSLSVVVYKYCLRQ